MESGDIVQHALHLNISAICLLQPTNIHQALQQFVFFRFEYLDFDYSFSIHQQ